MNQRELVSQSGSYDLLPSLSVGSLDLLCAWGLEKAIEETPGLLTENEKIKIDKAISSLQKAVILDNQEDILIKIDGLNSLATVFIQKHLDKGVDMHLNNT